MAFRATDLLEIKTKVEKSLQKFINQVEQKILSGDKNAT